MMKTCLPVFVLLLILATTAVSPAKENKPSTSLGSISGIVVCPSRGGIFTGRVELTQNGDYVGEAWVDEAGMFSIADVEPGSYELQYYDLGEIPLGDKVSVRVRAGRDTAAEISVPVNISGMDCEEMLGMGFEQVNALIEDAFAASEAGGGGLSELGSDQIARAYGQCKEAQNNDRIRLLPKEGRDQIIELRDALADFEYTFYLVEFFGGTAVAHCSIRSQVPRENFIAQIIPSFENPESVDPGRAEEAVTALDELDTLGDRFEVAMAPYQTEGYPEALDEFRASASNLHEVALGLPDDVLVQLIGYLQPYFDEAPRGE